MILTATQSGQRCSAVKLVASRRPLVIGHRGCCARAPENTLPSFEFALDAGADLIELDYQHSRDGVPMVIHDATLDRTTDARKKWRTARIKVADKTAAEIQRLDAGSWFDEGFSGARVPRLSEALEFICSHGGVALIEHKSGNAETLAKILRAGNWLNRVMVISFDWQFLWEFHALVPKQIVGALGPPICLAGGAKPPVRSGRMNASWLDELAPTGARIAVWNRSVSRHGIALAQRRGLRVWIYTVNRPRQARQLLEIGVDGLITNDPGRRSKFLDAHA